MIRKFSDHDIDIVMQIWLNTNIQAHNFISPDYWRNSFDMVKEMLPYAEIYVYENDNTHRITGFVGLNDNFIEGVFVEEAFQSNGIGKQLLNYAKRIRHILCLHVYQKNTRAIRFYLREKFKIQSEGIDDNTAEKEFTMIWSR